MLSLSKSIMGSSYQIVLTTCPDPRLAESMATTLVEERLAACVNILPPMRSVYRWSGKIRSGNEQLLIIKIRADDYAAVQRRLEELHPYELPEVIAVPILNGLPAYLAWLENPDATS